MAASAGGGSGDAQLQPGDASAEELAKIKAYPMKKLPLPAKIPGFEGLEVDIAAAAAGEPLNGAPWDGSLRRVLPWLCIGGSQAALDVPALAAAGVVAVVNMAGRHLMLDSRKYPGMQYLRVEAADHAGEAVYAHMPRVAEFLRGALASGGSALVHCQAGVNRSGFVVAALVALTQGMDVLQAVRTLRAARGRAVLTNSAFRRQLLRWSCAHKCVPPAPPAGAPKVEEQKGGKPGGLAVPLGARLSATDPVPSLTAPRCVLEAAPLQPEWTAGLQEGNAHAMYSMGCYLADSFHGGSEGLLEDAANLWLAAAVRGHAAAAAAYGQALMDGAGEAADEAAGLQWLQAAADAGVPAGHRLLGVAHMTGAGVPVDMAAAVAAFRAAGDDAAAMFNLAGLLENGTGVEEDAQAALQLYAAAAAHGDADAAYKAHAMYRDGDGSAADPVRAGALLSMAAHHTHCAAQVALAEALLAGDKAVAVEADAVAGRAMLAGACLSNHLRPPDPAAMRRMSELCAAGIGGPAHARHATEWLAEADKWDAILAQH